MPDGQSKGYPEGSFAEFAQRLSSLSLVALRHDAVREGDTETKDIIDAELKSRDVSRT
jgi:hypothetical protein